MSFEHSPEVATATMKAASAATYGGGGVAFASGVAKTLGLTQPEWAVVGVIGGLLIGVIGLVFQVVYRHKHFKLAERRAGFSDTMGGQ